MKYNRLILLLSSLSLVAVSSCNSQSSDNSSSSVVATTKKLSISYYPTNMYNQYDSLDLSDLAVSAQLFEGDTQTGLEATVSDYSLVWADSGQRAYDGEILLTSADSMSVLVTKEGYVSTSFTISVNPSSSFTQTLKVTSGIVNSYKPNSSFDPTGLVVLMKTSYVDEDQIVHNSSKTLSKDEYSISITTPSDETEAVFSSYALTESGAYKITIRADGYNDVKLSVSYSIYVYKDIDMSPKTYTDSTISWDSDDTTMTVNIKNPNKESTSDKGYYSPEEVDCDYNIFSYGKNSATGWVTTPTTGKVPLLVIPIKVPGTTTATEENWSLINKAFFGDSQDLDFESLHSYYYKSSFGQLDFTGAITEWFDTEKETTDLKKQSDFDYYSVGNLASEAVTWAQKTYNLDLSKYDYNKDGIIDGVWLVYSKPAISGDDVWWGYTSSTSKSGTVNNPVVNTYGWVSVNFLDGTVYNKPTECDAHVLIHESGHFLGLNDYYSYNSTTYSPLGTVDMMDLNIGDHNPYSKLLYGWVKPYIVYGNDVTITLKSSQLKDNLIIIPYDSKTYSDTDGDVLINFNMFDEYLVVDYYTDQNLNGSDYNMYSALHVRGKGIRLYHVDSRLMIYAKSSYTLPSDPDSALTSNSLYHVISNSEAGSRGEEHYNSQFNNAWDEIRWIDSDPTSYMSGSHKATNSSLFKTGDSFTLDSYSSQFVNGKFDNEKDCSYIISVR